ncbi:McrC family protein [Mycobacterium sp.]|uniref:McrC family protein n=1 Tax=Mycobacterium sp. TaxID=1785 RepID=UPI0039C8D80E
MDPATITLREYEKKELTLDAQQVRDLAASTAASLQLGVTAEGRYQLTAGNQVGTVVLPSVNVLIRPKVDIPDLFFLLSYARRLRWAPEYFPFAQTEDLFASLVRFFDAEMERMRVFGLARDYLEVSDTLATIRGRIDIAEQLRRRQLQPYPLECRFADYTDDIPLNRILKEAHSAALAIPGLAAELSARVRDRHRRMFTTVQSDPTEVDLRRDVHFTHLTAHWEPAYWLATLILSFRSLRDEAGRIVGRAFTVQMDRVFERFVQIVVSEELLEAGFEVKPQLPVALTDQARVVDSNEPLNGVAMRPDLVVLKDGRPVAVADVKYKRTDDIGDFKQPDIYQLFAYCAALGVPRGLLIYADQKPHTSQRAALPGLGGHIDIDAVGINLSLPWRSVLDQTKSAATVLEAIAKGQETAGKFEVFKNTRRVPISPQSR